MNVFIALKGLISDLRLFKRNVFCQHDYSHFHYFMLKFIILFKFLIVPHTTLNIL